MCKLKAVLEDVHLSTLITTLIRAFQLICLFLLPSPSVDTLNQLCFMPCNRILLRLLLLYSFIFHSNTLYLFSIHISFYLPLIRSETFSLVHTERNCLAMCLLFVYIYFSRQQNKTVFQNDFDQKPNKDRP